METERNFYVRALSKKYLGEEVATANCKKALGAAPYCAWTPVGGEYGTLIVSGTHMRKGKSKTGSDYFISYDNGKTWETVPHIIPYTSDDHVGYSNSFAFSKDGKTTTKDYCRP